MRRSRPLAIAEASTWLESAPDVGPPPGLVDPDPVSESELRSTLILPWWVLPDASGGPPADPAVSLTPSPRPLPLGASTRTETLVRVVEPDRAGPSRPGWRRRLHAALASRWPRRSA